MRNTALNIARAAKRRGNDCREELSEILSEKNTVEKAYDSRETARLINSFLADTSKKNRQIFTARYYFGMSVKSVAESFGMSETAVKSRLSRIRSELRKYLSERGVEV